MSTYLRSWWRAEGGGREVVVLALPLVISTSSWTLMLFIDRVFLSWYNPDALAASMPSSMLAFTLTCFFLGIASYVNTFVAQYFGAGHAERIGVSVWQGILVGAATFPLIALLVPFAPQIFALVGHETAIQRMEVSFFSIVLWGMGASVMSAALSGFFTGRGRTRTVMVVDIVMALINIVLDYIFIFGRFGFPEMGIAGAAIATTIAYWFQFTAFGLLFLLPANRREFGTWSGARFDRELFGRLLKFGFPSGFQMLIDVIAFTFFIMLVGRLGHLELIVANVAFNINMLAFVPMLGAGIAVTTLVGQRLGENRPDLAARSAWSAAALSTGYMATISMVYLLAPEGLLYLHGASMDPDEFTRLTEIAKVLLRFVALYCMFDTLAVIFMGALKGAGDTRFILYVSTVLAVSMSIASYIGIEVLGLGLFGAWSIITVAIMSVGIVYTARFIQGKWRSMRVIESEYTHGVLPETVAEAAPVEV
ncbi:MAG: MATE family efflux transporter [Pirellulales bacterium]|nr:MATE family efflux transporter [Pirellulales bacterium]